KCRSAASRRDDHGHAPADHVPGQRYKSIGLTIRGTEINCRVSAFDVTGVFQRLAECRHQVKVKGLAVEKSDHRKRRLLRARRERPRGRAAEQRDELAASQLIELHAVSRQPGQDCRIPFSRTSVSTFWPST